MKAPLGRFPSLRCAILFRFLLVLCVLLLSLFYVLPLRNLLFRSFWPRAWRGIPTADVITIRHSIKLLPVTDLPRSLCPREVKANATSGVGLSPSSTSDVAASQMALRAEAHASFLPKIDDDDKREMLQLYTVLADALRGGGVGHFFVDGSLLGAVRHGGLIPWDDDIDIGVSGSDWQKVRSVLSCIEGYELRTKPFMHWKFHRVNKAFPFIDIFFYTQNESYLWSMTGYLINTVVYPVRDVFPLKTVQFETLQVPVPMNAEKLADDVFGVTECQSPSINHKTGEKFPVRSVPCSALEYIYPMKHNTINTQ